MNIKKILKKTSDVRRYWGIERDQRSLQPIGECMLTSAEPRLDGPRPPRTGRIHTMLDRTYYNENRFSVPDSGTLSLQFRLSSYDGDLDAYEFKVASSDATKMTVERTAYALYSAHQGFVVTHVASGSSDITVTVKGPDDVEDSYTFTLVAA